MSKEHILYSQAVVATARNAAYPGSLFTDGRTRSFRRVLAFLGVSATVASAWYAARFLFQWINHRKTLIGSTSEVFIVENNNIETNQTIGTKDEIDWGLRRQTVKVTLHQCPRGYYTPCIAPFPMKLETFLRVANLSYEIDFSGTPPNKTSPWMTIDGVDISESHECIPLLCSTFGIDLEKSAQQQSRRTASRLVGIMLDNHIYWGIALWRWVYDAGKSLKAIQPLSIVGQDVVTEVSASVTRASWYHGLGRLSKDQVIDLVLTDLYDLSAALGNHDYFLGAEPGEVDCNAFAMLSQMVWNMPNSPFEQALQKYENLTNFVLRMREKFWPDWDALLQKHGDVELPDKLFYPTGEFQSRALISGKEPLDLANSTGNSDAKENTEQKSLEAPKSSQEDQSNNGSVQVPSKTIGQHQQAQAAINQDLQPSHEVVAKQNQIQFQAQHPYAHSSSASAQQQYYVPPPVSVSQQNPDFYEAPAKVYAPSYAQGPIYPAMTLNNTVVNQDEKLIQQQREQDALLQQQFQLNQNNRMAALQQAQQQFAQEQQYYDLNNQQIYQEPDAYDLTQLVQYEQQIPQTYLSNNPFLPEQMQIPPGYIFAPNNRLVRNPQFGPDN